MDSSTLTTKPQQTPQVPVAFLLFKGFHCKQRCGSRTDHCGNEQQQGKSAVIWCDSLINLPKGGQEWEV